VDILDIIHVAGYVQRAAKALYSPEKQREAFSRETLGKLLAGEVESVIHSLQVRAGLKKLKGKSGKEIATVCGYFERNKDRMRYDEYLSHGYPIGTGVIEGACRHLVKDRRCVSSPREGSNGAYRHALASLVSDRDAECAIGIPVVPLGNVPPDPHRKRTEPTPPAPFTDQQLPPTNRIAPEGQLHSTGRGSIPSILGQTPRPPNAFPESTCFSRA